MIISDLEHLEEVVAQQTNLVGGTTIDKPNFPAIGISLDLPSNSPYGKTLYIESSNFQGGSILFASVKPEGNGVSSTASSASWRQA